MKIDPDQVLWSAPEGERAGRPLLLMMHGHNSDESVGFELRHHLPADLVLASLRAPMRASGGYAWFRLDPAVGIGQANDVAQGVLSWLDQQPPAPSIGLLGFSQGAATAAQVLRSDPARFDYGVFLSGFVVPGPVAGDVELATLRPPVFWGRGTQDSVIPAYLIDLARPWLAAHTTLEEQTYPGLGHMVSPAELSDLGRFLTQQLLRCRQ